jgi:23S rRNA pseudouridine955/2504/2580 synthase
LIKAFRRPEAALLALFPETGRTHQIRVQAAVRSHPIIGDARYGNFEANRKVGGRLALKRMFLHCGRVELIHPKTGQPVTFEAPLPAALEAVLARLESLET